MALKVVNQLTNKCIAKQCLRGENISRGSHYFLRIHVFIKMLNAKYSIMYCASPNSYGKSSTFQELKVKEFG